MTLTEPTRWQTLDGAPATFSGPLIGRTPAPDAPTLTQHEAVRDALAELEVPVVLDVDFGHQQPMMPLVLGASTRVLVDGADQRIVQDLTRSATSPD